MVVVGVALERLADRAELVVEAQAVVLRGQMARLIPVAEAAEGSIIHLAALADRADRASS